MISLYLPISPHISLYLPISPYISFMEASLRKQAAPYLPISPHISLHLPTSCKLVTASADGTARVYNPLPQPLPYPYP